MFRLLFLGNGWADCVEIWYALGNPLATAYAVGCFIFDFFSQNVSFRPDSHYFIFLMKFGARYSPLKPIL